MFLFFDIMEVGLRVRRVLVKIMRKKKSMFEFMYAICFFYPRMTDFGRGLRKAWPRVILTFMLSTEGLLIGLPPILLMPSLINLNRVSLSMLPISLDRDVIHIS